MVSKKMTEQGQKLKHPYKNDSLGDKKIQAMGIQIASICRIRLFEAFIVPEGVVRAAGGTRFLEEIAYNFHCFGCLLLRSRVFKTTDIKQRLPYARWHSF